MANEEWEENHEKQQQALCYKISCRHYRNVPVREPIILIGECIENCKHSCFYLLNFFRHMIVMCTMMMGAHPLDFGRDGEQRTAE